MATDGDNDLMLYSLEGDDADAFDVVERDPGEGTVSVADDVRSWTTSPIRTTYSFMVKASDPSGASDSVMVTVTLKGVDEDPVAPEGVTNAKEVDYAEGDNTMAIGTYVAVDPEGEDVTYSVSDEDNFAITEDGGVLTFNEAPDFESMDSYTVTVEGERRRPY